MKLLGKASAKSNAVNEIQKLIEEICGIEFAIIHAGVQAQKTDAMHGKPAPVSNPELKRQAEVEKKAMKSEEEMGKYKQETEGEFTLFENAGLILLHPFLKMFFSATGLMDEEDKFTDKELAVHVLHYLATGKEQDWEHTLLFEKYLCDVPLTHPLEKEITISTEIKKEADNLLKAVLEYWTGLQSSSAELLQQEFLQREAKLIEEFDTSRLLFERKTFDILMDSLPWNLGIVKLSWRDELLYVEW